MSINTLDEMLIGVERLFERRLAAIALSCPQVVARMETRPEIDQDAVAFFVKFDCRRSEILAATEDNALLIANNCATYREFSRFRDALMPSPKADEDIIERVRRGTATAAEIEMVLRDIEGINPWVALPTIEDELIAMRIGRKTLNWARASGIIKEVAVNA